MGSFKPSGGRLVRRFRAEGSDGTLYRVAEYEIIIRSQEVHQDQMSRHSRRESYFELEEGTTVVRIEGEADLFKIVGSDQLIRKISD